MYTKITKLDAKQQGLRHYFTGRPCIHGHIDRRWVSTGICMECSRLNCLAKTRANPEANRARVLAWQKANPEKHAQKTTAHWRMKQWGITPDDVKHMLKIQNNKCAICKRTFSRSPHLDHNHETGKIRALLCQHCNQGLGHFRDNPNILQEAILYLHQHS